MEKAFEELDTLHELLGVALDDLEAVLADPRYEIHMSRWHESRPKQWRGHVPTSHVCHVCLAGSVMAKSLGAPLEKTITLSPVPAPGADPACHFRLLALNNLRNGDIGLAWERLQRALARPRPATPSEVTGAHARWHTDPVLWRYLGAVGRSEGRRLLAVLRRMQADLKARGI